MSIISPDFPIPITILPQLGSSPATAVFTKGEFAIEKAIFFALLNDLALIIFTVKNFFAPSPSTTICFARFKHNFFKANSNLWTILSFRERFWPILIAFVENIATISLVDWSLSTVIALKVLATALFKSDLNKFEFISALVKINDNIVAKFGAIIPEPFATPHILTSSSPIIISS